MKQHRLYTDASFTTHNRTTARSGGGIVVVDQTGKIVRAFIANYSRMDLPSSSAAEMMTIALALQGFHKTAVSITSDSREDVNRVMEFVRHKNGFRDNVMPRPVKAKLCSLDGALDDMEFRHVTRTDPYIKVADSLSRRAVYAPYGKVHEIPVVDGVICERTLELIAPLPKPALDHAAPALVNTAY